MLFFPVQLTTSRICSLLIRLIPSLAICVIIHTYINTYIYIYIYIYMNGDRETFILSVQLASSRIGNHTWLIHTGVSSCRYFLSRQYGIKLVVTCVVADSDAILGSGDKKNPPFL